MNCKFEILTDIGDGEGAETLLGDLLDDLNDLIVNRGLANDAPENDDATVKTIIFVKDIDGMEEDEAELDWMKRIASGATMMALPMKDEEAGRMADQMLNRREDGGDHS